MHVNVTAQSEELATIPVGTPVAVDNIAGSDFQRVKIAWGVENSAVDASATDPFPVTLANAGTLPTGAATEAKQDSSITQETAINTVLGVKGDAKSAATDTTAITAMSVWKQISASIQAAAASLAGTLTVGTHAVTGSGNFASTVADGANVVEGSTTGAAVITDANGTIQQYLRGLVKQWAAGALGVVLTAETTKVIGTVRVASGGIASGSLASGSVASGAVASGAVASGAFASGSISDGANVTQGAKADAKSSATDTTAITIMQVLKQISFSIQAAAASLAGTITVAAHAVTNAGTFAVQETTIVPVSTASLTSLASSASSAQLLASNASRKGLLLSNTDANAVLIKYGTTASATSFTVRLIQNSYWEMPKPVYTGRLDAIWEADGSGSLYATEL